MNPLHVSRLLGSEKDREAMDDALFRPLHIVAASNSPELIAALVKEKALLDVQTKVRVMDKERELGG